jgi:OHCU decarboxylase
MSHDRALGLAALNALPPPASLSALSSVCASPSFIASLLSARPFPSVHSLLASADGAWAASPPTDMLAAFTAHPPIGAAPASGLHGDSRFAAWSKGEQGGVDGAGDDVKARLARGNENYYERHGFVFLVCATGKSAVEMLTLLEERIGNDREMELRIAAEEQRRIIRIRLEKLLDECALMTHSSGSLVTNNS